MHRVHDRTVVEDGNTPLKVPAGWQIADGNANDIRVCIAHPWQSECLVFANGDAYGTAAGKSGSRVQNLSQPGRYGYGWTSDEQGAIRIAWRNYDVLLRRWA
jgi:hypothetical protein